MADTILTDVKDRRYVVTGAASGIGRAVAVALARGGARVYAVDRNESGLAALAEELEATAEVVTQAADLTEPESVERFSNAAVEHFGQLDGLFNNAGVEGASLPITELSIAEWRAVMAVNVESMFLTLKYLVPAMGRGGAVVNTASTLGLVGAPDRTDYVVSKHAVVGLTRAAAVELARKGIRVNCICPGPVDTPMMARHEAFMNPTRPEAERRRLEEEIPIGRYGQESEIARLVVFLLAPGVDYLTGAAISIDGGFVAL